MRQILGFLFMLVVLLFPSNGFSETFVLESGEEVQGQMVGKDDQRKTITISVNGTLRTIPLATVIDIKEMHQEEGVNTLPMYGGASRSRDLLASDQALIEEAMKQAGSREAASREFMRVGWEYFDRGDLNTAMKRFNQAWLVNPENADAFWGFGSVSLAKQRADEAIDMFEQALALRPQHAVAMCSLGSAYQLKAHQVQSDKRAADGYLGQSARALEDGAALDPKEEFCYSTWAGTLLLQGKPDEAWKKVRIAQKLGGKTLSPDFLQALSTVMPAPQDTE